MSDGRANLSRAGSAGRRIHGALGQSIFTEADDLDGLREMVRDAVRCHFDEGRLPRKISVHTDFLEQES